MDRDFKICIKCTKEYGSTYRDTPCWTHRVLKGGSEKYNEDLLSGVQMPGCDKLLEHGVSVNIDKTVTKKS